MKVYIDADGCPVVRAAANICKKENTDCIIVCDTAHQFDISGTQTVTVDKGADSTDFKLTNLILPGDIAITQDYGLAAMCLSRGAKVIDQNGMIYDDSNILSLLERRAAAKKVRNSGGRLKGPKKRSAANDADFERAFTELLKKH